MTPPLTPARIAEIEALLEPFDIEDLNAVQDWRIDARHAIRDLLAERALREVRRREILEWLQEQIGTGWTCQCWHMMYHAYAPWCHDCGAEAPIEHAIAFKLHAALPEPPSDG